MCNADNKFVIALSARWRLYISCFLYLFNKKGLNNSILIVMGGKFSNDVARNLRYKAIVSEYKKIFVETAAMKNALNDSGINNVCIYPNCREKPIQKINIKPRDGKLKCIFFSMIYPEKGVDTILEAACRLSDIEFDFWGNIDKNYCSIFLNKIRSLENCEYRGVFKSDVDNVYELLNTYDIMLFPTRLTSEGVPGTLIEAKIAALPAIVSDVAFNSSIVKHMNDGIVLNHNNCENLMAAIRLLDHDDALLSSLKKGALKSADDYYIEKYIDEITCEINL